ncbi:hypothetical protein Tco_0598364 [Tanacetum coccineum]
MHTKVPTCQHSDLFKLFRSEGRPTVQQLTANCNCIDMTQSNKYTFSLKSATIFLLLIGHWRCNYSTVDACNTANEMWIAIERLQQGESLNIQDVKSSVLGIWEVYFSRWRIHGVIVRLSTQAEKIDTVHITRLFEFLKQFQLEVNDIRSERIAKSTNPLALIAAAQPYSDNYYQAPKPQRSNATSSSTRTNGILKQVRGTRKCKEFGHLLAIVFHEVYKLHNNTFRTSSNTGTRIKIQHEGITMTSVKEEFGIKGDNDSCWARGNSKAVWKAKGVKGLHVITRKDNDVQTSLTDSGGLTWKKSVLLAAIRTGYKKSC